jgi:hypothetical protein
MFENLIFIAPFPLTILNGGGLIRSAELRNFLRTQSNNFIDIYVYDSKIWGVNDIQNHFVMPIDCFERSKYSRLSGYCADLDIVEWCATNYNVVDYVKKRLFHGEVTIWFEYPWLWRLVELLKSDLGGSYTTQVYYSSANVESSVYGDIVERSGAREYSELPEVVKSIESSAVGISDICIACSIEDLAVLNKFGSKRTELIPNGVSEKAFELSRIFDSSLYDQLTSFEYYFYAASDWPPNVSCVQELVGSNLGFIPPGKKLVVAGGASRVFNEIYLNPSSQYYRINSERIITLGRLDKIDYEAAHALASGYFLPVSYGGGTCLKTAEALFSGKHVLATKSAARGYEDFLDLPNFQVVDDEDFSSELAFAIRISDQDYSYDKLQVKKFEELTWQSHLNSFLAKLIT